MTFFTAGRLKRPVMMLILSGRERILYSVYFTSKKIACRQMYKKISSRVTE